MKKNNSSILYGNLLIFFSVFLWLSGLHAQDNFLASEHHPELRYKHLLGDVYYNDYIQIKGEVFLSEDWMQGEVILKNGDQIKDVKLKLDAYAHRVMVYHEPLKRVVMMDKPLIKEFIVYEPSGNRRFVLKEDERTKAKADDGSFIEVLAEGEISFYKLYYRDVLPLGGNEGVYLDEFIPEESYYIFRDGKLNVVRLRRGFFTRQYPQYKAELKQYFRQNKLQLKKQEDFAAAVNFLNALLSGKSQN